MLHSIPKTVNNCQMYQDISSPEEGEIIHPANKYYPKCLKYIPTTNYNMEDETEEKNSLDIGMFHKHTLDDISNNSATYLPG